MAVLHSDNVCRQSPDGARHLLEKETRVVGLTVCLALLGRERALSAVTDGPSCSEMNKRHCCWEASPGCAAWEAQLWMHSPGSTALDAQSFTEIAGDKQ